MVNKDLNEFSNEDFWKLTKELQLLLWSNSPYNHKLLRVIELFTPVRTKYTPGGSGRSGQHKNLSLGQCLSIISS